MDVLASLNREQRLAVETVDGPVCIIAGPGTGKTKTLVSRLFHMIHDRKIDPSAVLAVTFTRKAAAEMSDRLSAILPPDANLPTITTFHGLGYRLLDVDRVGDVRIIDDAIRMDIISELVERFPALSRVPLREILLRISRHKNMLGEDDSELTPLVGAYREELERRGMIDYDDLLLETFRRIETDQCFAHATGRLFSHILVDEFQDTNRLQYAIIRRLLHESHNLFVIGDPQQSIYSFRGADETIFDEILNDFPTCKHITLTLNYRSAPEILTAGCSLFPGQSLTAVADKGGDVTCVKTLNEYTEADWIVREISKKIGGTDLLEAHAVNGHEDMVAHFADFAVLYRTHAVAKTLVKRFEESGIPFQALGDKTPYERPEIACIISVLTYLDGPTPERLLNIYAQRRLGVPKESLRELADGREVQRGKKTVSAILHHLTELASAPRVSVSMLVDDIVERFGLRKYVEANDDTATAYRQFCASTVRFDAMENGLKHCVSYIEQMGEHDYYDPVADRVSLLTIHAAKGLEFPYVFICGFEEGLIPFIRDAEPADEEKRLLFVAMTRAKKGLYLTETKTRFRRKTIPSQYKEAMASHITQQEDEASERVETRNEKRRLKKSQMSMF